MKNFLKYMGPYKWWVVLTIVFIVAQSLSDLFLPDLNATIIDQGVMKGDIPVIIISAESTSENLFKSFSFNAADFICKPFEPQTILERVAAALEKKK